MTSVLNQEINKNIFHLIGSPHVRTHTAHTHTLFTNNLFKCSSIGKVIEKQLQVNDMLIAMKIKLTILIFLKMFKLTLHNNVGIKREYFSTYIMTFQSLIKTSDSSVYKISTITLFDQDS